MNTRLLSGIAGGCIAGFVAGWFLHPAASAPTADEASVKKIAKLEADLKTRTAELDRVTVSTQKAVADKKIRDEGPRRLSGDSPEVKKMQDRMKERMAQREKLKLDEKVAALKARLGLTDEQAAAVRELMAKDPGGTSFIARAMSGEKMDEKKAMAEMLKPGRKDGELTASIAALLTPEQQAAYTAFRQEQRLNEVEVKANKELARLQTSLTLSPEQKDKAFEVLNKLADEEYDNPVNPMAGMMQQGMKMQGKNNNDPAMAEHMEELKAATDHAAERRKARVDAMRDVLSPEQLALYETQQKQGNMADMVDSAFGDMGGNPFFGGLEDDEEAAAGGGAGAGSGAGAKPKPPRPGR